MVAPVLRFLDIGFNANLKIEDVGPPDKLIAGFAPELFGGPLNEEDVLSTETISKDGRSYYQWYDSQPSCSTQNPISCALISCPHFSKSDPRTYGCNYDAIVTVEGWIWSSVYLVQVPSKVMGCILQWILSAWEPRRGSKYGASGHFTHQTNSNFARKLYRSVGSMP